MRVHAFVAVQLRIGAALSNAAEARFRAWARPRTDAVHTVTNVPDSDEARLRRYATAAFADDLVTTNAANLACRAGRLLCNGEKSSGARIVKTGDVLTLARPPERRTAARRRRERDAWISKRERLLAALRDEARHAPPLQVLYEDDAMAVVLKPAGPRDELAEYAERRQLRASTCFRSYWNHRGPPTRSRRPCPGTGSTHVSLDRSPARRRGPRMSRWAARSSTTKSTRSTARFSSARWRRGPSMLPSTASRRRRS